MSTNFFITPYKPKDVILFGCFELNLNEYRAKLLAKWQDIEFFPSITDNVVLFWRILKPQQEGEYLSSFYQLLSDLQTVTFGFDYLNAEFVHWQRSLVDPKCKLYFYNDSSFQPIEITYVMSLDEIQEIIVL